MENFAFWHFDDNIMLPYGAFLPKDIQITCDGQFKAPLHMFTHFIRVWRFLSQVEREAGEGRHLQLEYSKHQGPYS